MKRVIVCKYSCKDCGITNRAVSVVARDSNQDVRDWMDNRCIPAIAKDHNTQSPACKARTISNLMIPLYEDAPSIGASGIVPAKSGNQ